MDSKTKVYQVIQDNPLKRDVIVKQVECESEEIAACAIEEGRIVKANPHPNICECLEFVKETKEGGGFYVYVISPKMPKSLQDEINERIQSSTHFTEEELWKLAKQLISAYAFLQTKVALIQSIAHRDIKPDNILLDPEGNVKICDFGYATNINLSEPEMRRVLGTIPYFSPALRKALLLGKHEIAGVKHDEFKSDVYSLGICLVHATTFEMPAFVTSLENLQENIIDLLNAITNYSQDWVNLLKKMLEVEEISRPNFITLKDPLKYDDDQSIWDQEIVSELGNPLEITAKCGLSYVRVSPSKDKCDEAICMVSLKALEIDPNLAYLSADIVAVIDESGSMAGSRIEMVQQTLINFIDLMRKRDRLSIVTFSDTAERKCPLICCDQAGKEILKKIVTGLKAFSLTNISAGFVTAMDVLEQRRGQNIGASILLFTDGQHCEGPDPSSACFEKYRNVANKKVTIYTFGFGNDIDYNLLNALATEGNGSFYHITEESQIRKAFALAYGHITTVVATDVEVKININPGEVNCTIPLIYSKDRNNFFSLPSITANQQKDMVFKLQAECIQLDRGTCFEPVTVKMSYKDNEGTVYNRSINILVRFVPWQAQPPQKDKNVHINWYRARAAYCLSEAKNLANTQEFGEAAKILSNEIELATISQLQDNEYISKVIDDLKKSLMLVKSNASWQQGGDQCFSLLSYSHLSQIALDFASPYVSEQQKLSDIKMSRSSE